MVPEVQQTLGLFPGQGIEPDSGLLFIKAGGVAMIDAPGIAAAGEGKLGIEVKIGRLESDTGHPLSPTSAPSGNHRKGSYEHHTSGLLGEP
jgi:hypothetical protein